MSDIRRSEILFFNPDVNDGDRPPQPEPEILNAGEGKDIHHVHFDIDNPPTDPQEFLAFLKWYHGEERWKAKKFAGNNLPDVYDYSQITPEMIPIAIKQAHEKGIDIKELNPAQIFLANAYPDTDLLKKDEEIRSMRIELLKKNQRQLEFILAPQSRFFIHATPTLENAQNIMEQGLYCGKEGLSGSAISLDKGTTPIEDEYIQERIRATVMENNMQKLADSHRGYRYQVIIELPKLNAEQKRDYESKKERGEHIEATSYFIKPLTEGKFFGAEGVEIVYDAVLPPSFILGYIDLDEGNFIPQKGTG